MLAGSCIGSAVSKYQNGRPKVAKKAFNMGKAWSPGRVVSHADKIFIAAFFASSFVRNNILSQFVSEMFDTLQ